MSTEALTPMMQQYQTIRRSLPEDVLLFYRLGDFYEMFFEDAKAAAAILNLSLTKRGSVPMAGVPHHAAESYIARVIRAGRRVAICDQTAEAVPGKLVPREVTRIISAGTVSDPHLMDARRPTYLAAICHDRGAYGFAYLDLSTGDFRVTELGSKAALDDEVARVAPSEILVPDDQREEFFSDLPHVLSCDAYTFLPDQAGHLLLSHFGVHSLDGFGCRDLPRAVRAAGAMVHHLQTQLRRTLSHVRTLRSYRRDEFLVLDSVTQGNLELVAGRGGAKEGTLLRALDRTETPMGARLLREWILHPLRDLPALLHRQNLVADLLADPYLLHHLRETLRPVRDIERTLGRLSQGTGNPRDVLALKVSLLALPDVRAQLEALLGGPHHVAGGVNPLAARLEAEMVTFPGLAAHLERALAEEPPLAVKEGGIFRDGFDVTLDSLRLASREGKDWIAKLQQEEVAATGIKSLKVAFNAVFGYYIEVTKPNLPLVPARFHRKQTTANAERFITPELKEMEGKILGADERARHLEQTLFQTLRLRILEELPGLQLCAGAIALLDVLGSFAETARLFGHVRPALEESGALEMVDGRHPVLDQRTGEEKFVPNDVALDANFAGGEAAGGPRLLLLTGPNMAGKSTYIKQVALLTLMAQTGAFLPVSRARIGLVDRIFTRVGANDDLGRGQSTFMVEMNETANILHHATERSLVILDEIGRGTSTFDGLAIAWSVAEHLHDVTGARTLFATHYHEMTDLARTRPGVANANVAVREWNDQIIFLRKIVPGPAEKSFGIQVGRLAGLPVTVIERAKVILRNLEQAELDAEGRPKLAEGDGALSGPALPGAKARRVRLKGAEGGGEEEQGQLRLF